MNKKEISEIKKQFTPSNCAITRICGCLIDGEREKKTEFKDAFLSLPEEEMFKYFDLFRKCLSGSLGKNLIDLSFPLEAEREGGAQEFLMKLRASRLTDDALLDEFYDRINAEYDCEGSFLILLIHSVYDIPGKASDNMEMFDASDEVYEFLLCSICPVKLTKPGLCYNAEEGVIQNRIRDWLVEMPDVGFLFPAFTDRSTDIHHLLFYSKNAGLPQAALAEHVLGCAFPLPAAEQKETFNAFVEETLGEDCDYETVKNIHERLNEILEEKKEDPEPVTLDKAEIRIILAESGAGEEQLAEFESHYEETAGAHASLLASNIANTRRFEVRTPDVTIHTAPERADLIETRVIDGRPCLVIPMEGRVEVNGIAVSTTLQETEVSETAGADIPQ